MNSQFSDHYVGAPPEPTRWTFGLFARLAIIFAVLAAETLPLSYLIQGTSVDDATGVALIVRETEHWLFRFLIAYAVSFAMLVYLRGAPFLDSIAATGRHVGIRWRWLGAHAALLGPLAVISATLYAKSPPLPFAVLALAWHTVALAALATLFSAMAPATVWLRALRQTAPLPLIALVPAAAALLAIRGSQELWAPVAKVTFHVVQAMLRPICPTLRTDPGTLTLVTDHFSVTVSEICSGLEGIGLMLAFCIGWLWIFRREYYFPRAFVIIPAAVVLVFVLNAVRIAALVMIGDAGYPRIAAVGFHSQAGWIAFNLAAFAVAIFARSSTWLNRSADRSSTTEYGENPTAAYLLPLLAILAAGMLAHAMSAGFDVLYPLRLLAALFALWRYSDSYRHINWRASWRGLSVGVAVFLIWMAFAHGLSTHASMPDTLAAMPRGQRLAWITCRAAAAILTVPIAEELAYRGFLMRRLMRADFESVSWSGVHFPALALSSVAFGVMHGALWLPGILAGLAYGLVVRQTGKLGEAMLAHGTTNALIAGCVLWGGQWQLW